MPRRKNPTRGSAGGVDAHPTEIDYEWVLAFRNLVRERKMMAAVRMFRGAPDALANWPLKHRYTLIYLESCARLLDRDRGHIDVLAARLKEFREAVHFGELSVEDATRLKLGEAIIEFHKERFEPLIEPLKLIRAMADECGNDDLRAMSRYYLARCIYRIGKHQEAKEVIAEAEILVPAAEALPSIQMVKTWILFNEESVDEADISLGTIEKAIKGKDYIEDVNIATLKGRFARQRGDFAFAVESAREAIGIFENNDDNTHPLLARAHVHMAFALLLQARQKNLRANDATCDEWRRRAFESFREAQKICGAGHKRVLDRVHYFKGCWYLFLNKLDHAKKAAEEAFKAADEVRDTVIMAHARILQCQCAREESDRNGAQGFALEAQKYAEGTDNRRARARVLIWVGITQADPPLKNYKAARRNLELARSSLRSADRDYLLWEFQKLETIVNDDRNVNNTIVFPTISVDDVLNEGNIDKTLDRLAPSICEAVHKRLGSKKATYTRLRMGKERFHRLCPQLKAPGQTSGLPDD